MNQGMASKEEQGLRDPIQIGVVTKSEAEAAFQMSATSQKYAYCQFQTPLQTDPSLSQSTAHQSSSTSTSLSSLGLLGVRSQVFRSIS